MISRYIKKEKKGRETLVVDILFSCLCVNFVTKERPDTWDFWQNWETWSRAIAHVFDHKTVRCPQLNSSCLGEVAYYIFLNTPVVRFLFSFIPFKTNLVWDWWNMYVCVYIIYLYLHTYTYIVAGEANWSRQRDVTGKVLKISLDWNEGCVKSDMIEEGEKESSVWIWFFLNYVFFFRFCLEDEGIYVCICVSNFKCAVRLQLKETDLLQCLYQ